MSNADPTALLGKTLGSYTLSECLGVGGMGAVFLGVNPTIKSRVAIKVLRTRDDLSEEMVERLWDEARAANLIGHPGIVRIHDCGTDPEIGPFIVMEYMEGETLEARIKREGCLVADVAVRLLQQAASALAAAHAVGVIHRDLKASNLYIVPDPEVTGGERVKVLDFGIAKLLGAKTFHLLTTESGVILGSPLYMSPEQCISAKNVDHRTDIFSLGVLAYYMVCGRMPFQASTFGELVMMHQTRALEPLACGPECPPLFKRIKRVIERAMELDPERRQQSMAEFGAGLSEAMVLAEGDRGSELARIQTTQRQWGAPGKAGRVPIPPADLGLAETKLDRAGSASSSASEERSGPSERSRPETGSSRSRIGAMLLGGGLLVGLGLMVWVFTQSGAPETDAQTAAVARIQEIRGVSKDSKRKQGANSARVFLRLDLEPRDAEVILDGVPHRENPLMLLASPKAHRLEVRAPGYRTEVSELVTDRSFTYTLRLQPDVESKPDGAVNRVGSKPKRPRPRAEGPKPMEPLKPEPRYIPPATGPL